MGFARSPITAVLAGLVAGAIGTVAMDTVLYARYRRGGGDQEPLAYEFGGVDTWEKASVPGQLGKRLYEGYTQKKLGSDRAQLTNTIMHWGYGTIWGALYGVLMGSLKRPALVLGLPFGAAVWLSSYAIPPPNGAVKADLGVRRADPLEGLQPPHRLWDGRCLRLQVAGALSDAGFHASPQPGEDHPGSLPRD